MRRSGVRETRREPSQIPGSEPASNCASKGQSTEPSDAWPRPATKVKGTGLGLVIVKKIVEEHGGSVEIGNIEPHGARILISLPVASHARQGELNLAAKTAA